MSYWTAYGDYFRMSPAPSVAVLRELERLRTLKAAEGPDSRLRWRVYRRGEECDGDLAWGWIPNMELDELVLAWDGSDDFLRAPQWLQWLIERVFGPVGVKVLGESHWRGQDDDVGKLVVGEDQRVVDVPGEVLIRYEDGAERAWGGP